MKISVVVCTWNPRQENISRTISGLINQRMTVSDWELIVVDNNSYPALEARNIVLPANGRIIKEPTPGLTAARLCGIAHSSAPLVVFVDDDNVLSPDYLEIASQIAAFHPAIGVFGGRSLPDFEISPPDWMKPFWANLALHDFDKDRWTNQRDFSCFPCGAGMCLRREVALCYTDAVRENESKLKLDRTGGSLASAGDTDIVLDALKAGWGIGKFTKLSLTHIIPKERLTLEYHCRLAHGMGMSIGQINGRDAISYPITLKGWVRGFVDVLLTKGPARKVRWAAFRAYQKGLKSGYGSR